MNRLEIMTVFLSDLGYTIAEKQSRIIWSDGKQYELDYNKNPGVDLILFLPHYEPDHHRIVVWFRGGEYYSGSFNLHDPESLKQIETYIQTRGAGHNKPYKYARSPLNLS